MVLCLDAPTGLWNCADKGSRQTLAAAQTIHGGGSGSNGANRWFDKTVQVFFTFVIVKTFHVAPNSLI